MGFFINKQMRLYKKIEKDEPEFYESLQALAKEYNEGHTLRGDITTDLREILKRAPEPLLDDLKETYQIKGAKDKKRERLESLLHEAVLQSVSTEFPFLTDRQDAVLRKIALGRRPSRKDLAEGMVLMETYGWSYTFYKDEESVVPAVMPAEVAARYLEISNDAEKQQERRLSYEIRRAAVICANLYGIFDKDALMKVLRFCVLKYRDETDREQDEELWKSVKRTLDGMRERSGFIWRDKEYFIDEAFRTRSEYKNFLKKIESREYYLPSPKETLIYQQDFVNRKKWEYKCLKGAILCMDHDGTTASEWMPEIEDLVVKEGKSCKEVLNMMFVGGVACPKSEKDNALFERDLQRWIHIARKWKNRGFSDAELGKPVSEPEPPEKEIENEKKTENGKKIGRNAPCSCGSGKKYKHCCMNKQ